MAMDLEKLLDEIRGRTAAVPLTGDAATPAAPAPARNDIVEPQLATVSPLSRPTSTGTPDTPGAAFMGEDPNGVGDAVLRYRESQAAEVADRDRERRMATRNQLLDIARKAREAPRPQVGIGAGLGSASEVTGRATVPVQQAEENLSRSEMQGAESEDSRNARRMRLRGWLADWRQPGAGNVYRQQSLETPAVERLLAERKSQTEQAENERKSRAESLLQQARLRNLDVDTAAKQQEMDQANATLSETDRRVIAAYTGGEVPEGTTYSSIPVTLAGYRSGRPGGAAEEGFGPDEASRMFDELNTPERVQERGGWLTPEEDGVSFRPTTRAGRGGGSTMGPRGRGAAAAPVEDQAYPVEGSDEESRKREILRGIVESGLTPDDQVDAEVERLYRAIGWLPFAANSPTRGRSFEQAADGYVGVREEGVQRSVVGKLPELEQEVEQGGVVVNRVRSVRARLRGGRARTQDGKVIEIPPISDEAVLGAVTMLQAASTDELGLPTRIILRESAAADPETRRLAQDIMRVANPILRDISGAAVTNNEAARFMIALGAGALQGGRDALNAGLESIEQEYLRKVRAAQRRLDGLSQSRERNSGQRGN